MCLQKYFETFYAHFTRLLEFTRISLKLINLCFYKGHVNTSVVFVGSELSSAKVRPGCGGRH